MANKKLLVVVGSKNDIPRLSDTIKLFKKEHIAVETEVISAHRDIKKLVTILDPQKLAKRDIGVILAVAHSVANLPAIVAGYLKDTDISIVGVGLTSSETGTTESLLSVISIPKGIPLMNTGVNAVGLENAALCCIKILKSHPAK